MRRARWLVGLLSLTLLAGAPAAASAGAGGAEPPDFASRFAETAPISIQSHYSRCGNSSGRVLLTFDDWAYGDPYRATRTGAYLKSRNIRAMFFLIGEYAEDYPSSIVAELRKQGHWVLNHSYSHPDLRTLSDAGVTRQIRDGVDSNLLRPPYGSWDSRVEGIAAGLGYGLCLWTIDTRDWEKVNGSYRSTSSIRSIVRGSSSSAKSSGIILGHLHTKYPDAVGGIIDDLHAQGYLFCRNRGAVSANAPQPLTCT